MDQNPQRLLPLRIFIVEDHVPTLRALQMFLVKAGDSVHAAATVEDALREIPKHECDLLLSDLGLPDGTGWELLKTLSDRKQAPSYAIAVSGYGTSADIAKSKEAGFFAHLLKPFNLDKLEALLDQIRQAKQS